MGFSEEDVRYATHEWIPKNHHIEYLGLRKILGALTRECIDHTKLHEYKKNGVKLVYGVLPAQTTTYTAIKMAGKDKVFVSFPDFNMMNMAQCLFNKAGRFFELAEQGGMTYGARHCALNKMRVGIRLSGMVPTPDVDWAWGLVCDEATKIDEYITHMYDKDWKTVTTRIPHDVQIGESGYQDEYRVKFLATELRRSMEEVEEIIGFKVKDEHVADAFKQYESVLKMGGQLVNLSLMADPQPLCSSTLQMVAGHPKTFPMNTGFEYYNDGLRTLLDETKKAIADGVGILPKGSPKVGFYFIPWALPWVDRLFIENGVVPSISMTMIPAKRQLEPSMYTDPYEKSAEGWLKGIFTMGCHEEVKDWTEKIEQFKPDAFVAGFLDYDRWIGALHKNMARDVEKQTGVPSFYLEADFYDGRDYSMEALRTRIESICQIIRAKRLSA